jgi:lipoprotein-anchoring transpeptidase ErfK/SrfK
VVVVQRGSNRLFLYEGTKFVRRLPVGTGRPANPTPLGRFEIASKIRHPWWYPPGSAHGCIRMLPREAEWLFRRVRVGTPVVIVPA